MTDVSAEDEWWLQVIRGEVPAVQRADTEVQRLRVVDLFCGSGGFTNGIRMAANAFGLKIDVKFAVDTDVAALGIYRQNHRPVKVIGRSVKDILDSQVIIKDGVARFYYDPVLVHDELEEFAGEVDLVVAGPPCQGHSNLNNHTRRDDVRNALYPTAAEIAVAVGAKGILIENVPAVLHDKYESVRITRELLGALKWSIDDSVMSAVAIGWPQTRKRHFLSASTSGEVIPLNTIANALKAEPRSLGWLLNDILDVNSPSFMDHVGKMSEENVERINFLFDNDLYTLPDHIRPKSHQDGHTYPSSYGRMRWDRPSGTITTGFMTPGRGRFVHPLRRRPITPREAARIQGFPDTFLFGQDDKPPLRSLLAKWIGDAVPGPLGYAAAMSILPAII
jgi:DNA (cytosine-5)-methyltransferase 1